MGGSLETYPRTGHTVYLNRIMFKANILIFIVLPTLATCNSLHTHDKTPSGMDIESFPIETVLTPNSYHARVQWRVQWNARFLEQNAKRWKEIKPQLVVKGHLGETRLVDWTDLEKGHENGKFNNFVRTQLASQFQGATQLVLITHGFRDGGANADDCTTTWVSERADDILNKENEDVTYGSTTTIAICWNSAPSQPNLLKVGKVCLGSVDPFRYYPNACTTGKVGELLANILTAIKEEFPDVSYIHGIGHSLGAHIMGNIYNFGNLKIDRISGLDPAGPCFEGSTWDINIEGDIKWGLTADSAHFIDNYHTDTELFGTRQSKGHLDFFLGDPEKLGGTQPSCNTCFASCCHSLAKDYFTYSITHDWKTNYLTESQNEADGDDSLKIGDVLDWKVFAGYAAFNLHPENSYRMFLPVYYVNGTWSTESNANQLDLKQNTKFLLVILILNVFERLS